jgi:hypothetical protein
VAVKTTVANLKTAILESPLRIFLGEVKYVDWDSPLFPNNSLAMCFRKDESYEHEKEVRAVIWDIDLINKCMSDALEAFRRRTGSSLKGVDPFTLRKEDGQRGIELPFDPNRFVTEVVVGPRETPSVADLVKRVMDRYGLKIKMTISNRLMPRR